MFTSLAKFANRILTHMYLFSQLKFISSWHPYQPQNIPVSSSSMCRSNVSILSSGSDSVYLCHRELRSGQYSVHFEVLESKRSCAITVSTHSEAPGNRGRCSINVTELPRMLKLNRTLDLAWTGTRCSQYFFSFVSTRVLMSVGSAISSPFL